jgi:hypothetical protein
LGNQTGLDNIPASAIEKIEIINNLPPNMMRMVMPELSILFTKKNKQNGFNGKVGFTTGLGSLWVRKENLPTIRPQYTLRQNQPSEFHSIIEKNKVNVFQGDYLYTET